MTDGRRLILSVSSIVGLLGAACVPVGQAVYAQHVLIGARRTRPVPVSEVRLVMPGEATPPSLEEIAIVQAFASEPDGTRASALEALKTEAGSLGANALVDVKIKEDTKNFMASGVAVYVHPERASH